MNNFQELIEGLKAFDPKTTYVFEKWMKNNASNVPFYFVSFSENIPGNVPAFTNEQGVYINKVSSPIIHAGSMPIFFVIIHEIGHYLDFKKYGEKMYDKMDDSFEDFYEIITKFEMRADDYAERQMKKINAEAKNQSDKYIMKQPFGIEDVMMQYKMFMNDHYNQYIENKEKYKNFGEFQKGLVLGKSSLKEDANKIRKIVKETLNECLNENKISSLSKLEITFNKLVEEAGSVENLSKGVSLGYNNFGNFVDVAYNIVDVIKRELEEIATKKQGSRIGEALQYKDILLKLKEKTDKINYIKGVSEYSVEQFKFVKRNIDKMLNAFNSNEALNEKFEFFELPHKDWFDLTDDEKTEILFGKQSNLNKQFSKIMVDNLMSEDDEIAMKWATYNAASIELENYDDMYNLELEYRITDGENPNKVVLSIISKIQDPSKELIRLKEKISQFNSYLDESYNPDTEYYTTSAPMLIDEFIELEVEERENYDIDEVNRWIAKYNITPETELLWVATLPYIAARYQMNAEDWNNAEAIYNANKDNYDIQVVNGSEGTIIDESDDGEYGFVMVLNK